MGLDERWDRMEIPLKYRECSWDKIPDGLSHKKIVKKYSDESIKHLNNGAGLLLYGPNSTGKTALGSMLLMSLPKRVWGLFVIAEKIPSYIIEKTMFDEDMTYVQRMQDVDLLIIDEIILHSTDTFRDTCVESIIRDRILERKATIITTNFQPEEIKEKYSSLFEVLMECTLPIPIMGHNFRADLADKLKKDILG
jgi:DNA replication protein DnaC